MSTTNSWNVTVLVPHPGAGLDDPTPMMDELLQALEPYSPAVAADGRRVGARLWIDAPDALSAAAQGVAAWTEAGRRAALTSAPPVEVTVVSESEFRSQAEEANFPALVGVSEIADLLGVSRARASEISRTSPAFPRPVAQLAAGAVWTESSVRAFADDWPRRPGRPRRLRLDDGPQVEPLRLLSRGPSAE